MMLFDDGDAALLKKWIVKRLEDMYVLLSSLSSWLFQLSPGVRRWVNYDRMK